ncbi:Fc receptor-like protein 5 isoform X3 [Rhinolophus sinicus]|uniref:Fc receptor-like protein 5 isoform X3 n=1 Tax=Rhinolophus sinicus TaxID=89399 RepID=UPI003D7A6BA2
MLLWVSLLALASVSGQLATAPKPVISLQPPWTTTFQGESVLLTCNGFPINSPRETTWFYQNQGSQTSSVTPGNTRVVQETGKYQCQHNGSSLSDSVHLIFSSAPLILQAPLSVFEGDTMVLRCLGRPGSALKNTTMYKNQEAQAPLRDGSDFRVHGALLRDNGQYHCKADKESCCSVVSNTVEIQVQELFRHPRLTASPSQPTEGSPVNLTCETQLPLQRSDVQLQFCFFRERQALGSGCSSFPELQIPAMWREDTGSYWCQAQTVTLSVTKKSPSSHIHVRRAVPSVQIHTRPPQGSVFEGQELVLVCSVRGVPGPISVSWYRRPKLRIATEITLSRDAEFRISTVKSSYAGKYYCVANSIHSTEVTINIRVPVSRPLLTRIPRGYWASEGDEMTLRCEAQRGSLPILYQFFHEDALLKEIEATSWRASSFRFRLTEEHSGSYYCTADNGLGPQRSEAVTLSVHVPVSRPVLTFTPPASRAPEGDVVTLRCEAQRGSLPIQFRFFREYALLKEIEATSWRASSFRFRLTEEQSGSYYCTASNGLGPQRSAAVTLSVHVPVSHPVLTLRPPGAQASVGDEMTLHCEGHRGSLPIRYQFFHEDALLKEIKATSWRESYFRFRLTEEHSGSYYCTANNGLGPQRSAAVTLSVIVPASQPILTLRAPRAQALVGDTVELHCEAQTGSPPILYRFYHDGVTLGSSSAPSGGGVSFNLSLTAEHSGNYSCEADNVLGAQRSEVVPLSVTVPASRPVLTLRAPGAQALVGDTVELHCEAQTGSPPILYRFYHDGVTLGNSSAPSGGGVSFNLSLTAEHSGNYSCEANNGLGAQLSEVVTLSVTVPATRPVLTLRAPRAQALVGDTVELHCEAQTGSPPILYRFYHDGVTLGNNSAPSGGGVSFNLSLTAEHSGNYSCEADNGLGAQLSEVVTLSITGLTGSRGGHVATGVTGVLLSLVGLAAVVLLFYYWLPGRAGGRPACDASSSSSHSDPQEPTYHNVPAWLEMQPVYSNVNPKRGDVVYSEVCRVQGRNKRAAGTTARLPEDKDSSVIYSQVKVTSTPGSRPQRSASSAPHR